MKQNFQIQTQFLGLIPYVEGLGLMNKLRERRLKNLIPDQLLFLEHPPVITTGRRLSETDLKLSRKSLEEKNIEFVNTDRGGKLTYHGPGQMIVYFIFDIRKRKLSIDQLVSKVEEGARLLLETYDVPARRDDRNPGLWIGNNKILSIGFHIYKGVTTHGIALNVFPDLEPFSFMIPCGLEGVGVTSILKETGLAPQIEEVSQRLAAIYEKIWLTEPDGSTLSK